MDMHLYSARACPMRPAGATCSSPMYDALYLKRRAPPIKNESLVHRLQAHANMRLHSASVQCGLVRRDSACYDALYLKRRKRAPLQ